jgi:hypothetical protein
VTLIEAVLYIAIALALIVGGLVFFQQASTAAKTSTMVRQLSAVLAEARVLIKGQPVSDDPANITPLLISAGAVPADMVASATSLTNPFGGTTAFYTQFQLAQQTITIHLTNVPQGVCARLLTATSGIEDTFSPSMNGATTLVSSGFVMGGVAQLPYPEGSGIIPRSYVMNPTQAGWMCKYGSQFYPKKTTEPSTPPLSGNVDISMRFLVER